METLSPTMIMAPRRSLKALVQRSLLLTGFQGTLGKYLWYEVAHLFVLQLHLMSTQMMRPLLLFLPMHSELRMRQKPRRPRGRRRTSRGRVIASGLHVDDRLRLITKPRWSNMIANVWPEKPKKTSVVRTKGVDMSVTSMKSG
jgi:hypothetical protein